MQSDDDGFFNTVNEEAEADSSDSEGDVEDSEEELDGEDEEVPGSDEENDEDDDDDEEDLGSEDAEDLLSEEEDSSDLEGEDAGSEDEAGSSDDESEEDAEETGNEIVTDSRLEKTKNDQSETNKIESKKKTKKSIARNKQQPKSTSTSTDSGLDKTKDDEYADYDTSDEEDIRNTVGNIPMNWYDEYKHLGYDWDGKPIGKPESGDHLDNFLKRMEDPDFWRTVKDPQTGQDVVLSEEDIQTIQRLKAGKIPDVTFDEYAVRILFCF